MAGPAETMAPTRVDERPLRERVRAVMEEHWTVAYTVPNRARYPFMWLWDSCFHAVIWAELGDERGLIELGSVFRHQTASGFVPHMSYDAAPQLHARFWGRAGMSSITQPPMFGHGVAELVRRGFDVPAETLDRAARGLRFLLRRRRRVGGLVALCHPWESGADDSPRWDQWCAPNWDEAVWWRRKGELVSSILYDRDGAALSNPAFEVAGAGFNALVAFNGAELADVSGDTELAAAAGELAEQLDEYWDDRLETWVDAVPTAANSASVTARTLDALLPLLVVDRPMPKALFDPDGFGTPYGPSAVHRTEPSYDPAAYWRGSTWPQLTYLLAVAAARRGEAASADRLHRLLVAGADRSGLAEHWHAELGTALGAVPQSWAGLAIVRPSGAGNHESQEEESCPTMSP